MYLFPFKENTPLNLNSILTKHIMEKFGPDSILLFNKKIEELHKLRAKFDFIKYQAQISNDYKLGEEIEQNLIHYIKYVYLFDRLLYRQLAVPNSSFRVPFAWTDSFNHNLGYYTISNFKYELVSMLYNLIITYYTTANAISTVSNEDFRLKAINKFRCAIWCIQEIKNLMIEIIAVEKSLPADLNSTSLNVLEHLILGQIYSLLSKILQEKKADIKKLSSAQITASVEFKKSGDILFSPNQSIPKDMKPSLKIYLDYSIIYHEAQAYLNIMYYHLTLTKKDEELLEPHVGLAFS